jgi:hypothetical protein
LNAQVDEEGTEEGEYEANTRINTKAPTVIRDQEGTERIT